MDEDAPTQYIEAMGKSAMKDPAAQKMMDSPEKASGMMEAIASGNTATFRNKLNAGFKAVWAENAPKVPTAQQPGHIAEGPEGEHVPMI